MASKVILPRLTHDMGDGIFGEWLKAEGDEVARGDMLFTVETDKATAEVEAAADGILAGLVARPGDNIPVGTVIAYILAPGETLPDAPEATPEASAVVPAPPPLATSPDPDDPGAGGRIVATPLARKMARAKGVDLQGIAGSGPRGRIVSADVAQVSLPDIPQEYKVAPKTRIQQQTAARLVQMWQQTPQFVLEVSADMTEALRWRAQVEKRYSITTLLVRAAAAALRCHPAVNTLWVDGVCRQVKAVNVGVAMATDDGLVVPVIRHADRLTANAIQRQLDNLRARADTNQLALDDLSKGTFTISNLGMYGVDAFAAVINPPQAAILACGRIVEVPVSIGGQVVVQPRLCLRMTVDHRVLDGAQAAPCLMEIKRLLETPYLLI